MSTDNLPHRPRVDYCDYEKTLYDVGAAYIEKIGDGHISIVDEKPAAEIYKNFLLQDSHFFVDFKDSYMKDKTFLPEGEVVAL